ncbi:hypothetical protein QU660_08090 [Stomatobaculum sp. F0698]|uniref:hypothetical protein n=1 Tax=Stomatobaculum sp. F0698 TaxID=3059030 RepID=UPI00272B5970|nr:hypothetical protein [Stomatobaculum sp. F0698]WLD86441.1 hypothetical protein QU660_08090 [Stomatobaculum sp. F0698]
MSNCYRIKYPLVIAVVQWFITTILQVDRAFFTYDQETLYFVLTKILYLVFLILIWCFIFEVHEKVKQNDKDWKRGVSIFLPYFTILMIMLLILWPGTWAYDDLLTLTDISSYGMWCPWQNILTGAYQDVLLQILPFPGGIIFLQNTIISLCVAFSVVKIEKVFGIPAISNPVLDIVIKLLPFLLPPILMYQFSGYRMGIYVYLELVMLVILIGLNKTKSKWGWKKVLLFSVICSIISTWRTESFIYVPATCVLLLFVRKDVISKQKKVICISLIIMGFLGITRFQNWALGDSSYEVISLMRPCVEVVRHADTVRDAKELEAIDKVADIKIIMDNPGVNGETMYWNTACIRNHNDNPNDDYNSKDYQEFRKAFVALSLKYPNVVLKERWSLFIRASGITGDSLINAGFAARLFDADNDEQAVRAVLNKGWFANLPVFKGFRARFIETLGITSEANIFAVVLKRVIWNSIIPELILICDWIGICIRKRWYLAGIFATVLLKLPIIFLTEPSYWIMYVLSFYLLGYVVLVFGILKWKLREKAQKDYSVDYSL